MFFPFLNKINFLSEGTYDITYMFPFTRFRCFRWFPTFKVYFCLKLRTVTVWLLEKSPSDLVSSGITYRVLHHYHKLNKPS